MIYNKKKVKYILFFILITLFIIVVAKQIVSWNLNHEKYREVSSDYFLYHYRIEWYNINKIKKIIMDVYNKKGIRLFDEPIFVKSVYNPFESSFYTSKNGHKLMFYFNRKGNDIELIEGVIDGDQIIVANDGVIAKLNECDETIKKMTFITTSPKKIINYIQTIYDIATEADFRLEHIPGYKRKIYKGEIQLYVDKKINNLDSYLLILLKSHSIDNLDDAWGNSLKIELNSDNCLVCKSSGKDGVWGTDDDLCIIGK